VLLVLLAAVRDATSLSSGSGCRPAVQVATITGTCFFCFQPLLKLFVGNFACVVSEIRVALLFLVAVEATNPRTSFDVTRAAPLLSVEDVALLQVLLS
jgi:hypothetical protein